MTDVFIARGEGAITHTNVNTDKIDVPDSAEFFESREKFQERIAEFMA